MGLCLHCSRCCLTMTTHGSFEVLPNFFYYFKTTYAPRPFGRQDRSQGQVKFPQRPSRQEVKAI